MARITDQLLTQDGFNDTGLPIINPVLGGPFGYAPTPAEYLGAQGYKPNHLIPIVIETPRIYEYLPNPEKWIASWKMLWEKRARVIEGLKAGITIEKAEHAYGGAGEFFEEFVDVKRERSTLSTQFNELYGNLYQNFLEKTTLYGQMDPYTKLPLAATLDNVPEDLLSDMYSGVVAFIEPDPVGNKCVRAWLCVNVWHQSNGPVEGKMDKTSALTLKELSIDWTALSFYGEGVRQLGQELLNGISWAGADPNRRKSFVEAVAPDVAAVTQGWKESVETTGKENVGTTT